jgi:RNA-binding protein YlmH
MFNPAGISDLQAIETAVRGGRVVHTPFLEPDEAAAAAAALRERGIKVALDGGFKGAKRRVLTAYPEHIPHADTALVALYFAGAASEGELLAALRGQSLPEGAVGDVIRHQDGLSVMVLASWSDKALAVTRVGAAGVTPQPIDTARYAGKAGSLQVVVPSLRVDALGAKAFKVSRAYFSKGVGGGKVSLNGKPAGKASLAQEGDEVYAEGLGRFVVSEVQGETRKGNLKVVLSVERAS